MADPAAAVLLCGMYVQACALDPKWNGKMNTTPKMLSESLNGEFQGHRHFGILTDGRVNHSIEDPRGVMVGGSQRNDAQVCM